VRAHDRRRRRRAPYCGAAERFTAYLTRPPVLALERPARPARRGRPATVAFTLDKVSTVTLVARRSGRPVVTRAARLGAGRRTFTLPPLRSRAACAWSCAPSTWRATPQGRRARCACDRRITPAWGLLG
jgi:hypothetical protein